MSETSYENIREYLGQKITVKIERKMGDRHPKFEDHIYPINYGFVPGTMAPDGCEIDAYIVGVDEPLDEFTGVVKAIIHRTNDDDDKLVVMPEDKEYTDEEIRGFVQFQEKYFESVIYR